MPSFAIALRIFAIAFSVTVMPFPVVCVSVAVVIPALLSPLPGSSACSNKPRLARGLHSFALAAAAVLVPASSKPDQLAARGSRLLRFRGYRLGCVLLLFPVTNGGANGVLGQHRTVYLHGRKRQLFHDFGV